MLIQYSKNKNNTIFLKLAGQAIFDENNDFFESFSNCIDKIEKEGDINGIVLNLQKNQDFFEMVYKLNFPQLIILNFLDFCLYPICLPNSRIFCFFVHFFVFFLIF